MSLSYIFPDNNKQSLDAVPQDYGECVRECFLVTKNPQSHLIQSTESSTRLIGTVQHT